MAVKRRLPASALGTYSPTAASISCRTTLRSQFRTRLPSPITRPVTLPVPAPRPTALGAARREPISPVYSAHGGHLPGDGGHPVGWVGRLDAAACLLFAGGGLSDHSGAHVLSRRKSQRDGHHRNGAARASVRR